MIMTGRDDFESDKCLVMATRKGLVKRTRLSEYRNMRRNGLVAIVLRDDDELIDVKFTDNSTKLLLVTKCGQGVRFHEKDVRCTGRASMGVNGIRMSSHDEVVSMIVESEGQYMLTVSEKGLGKLTDIAEFPIHRRGGKGVRCYKIIGKTGHIVRALAVNKEDEIMMINTEGIIIRMSCSSISVLSRVTSGVKLMNLGHNERVVSVAKVADVDLDDGSYEDGEDPEDGPYEEGEEPVSGSYEEDEEPEDGSYEDDEDPVNGSYSEDEDPE